MRTRPLAVQVDTLKRAWALATEHHSTADHVAQAHEVISHCDGSSCDGGATCGIVPDGLLAYELAFEIADMHGMRFVDYVAAFATRDSVTSEERPNAADVEAIAREYPRLGIK